MARRNRKKLRNLNAQAKYVIAMSDRLSSSKTADRKNSKIAGIQDITLKYIYSIRELEAMYDVSRQFMEYVREHYPEIRMLRDLTVEIAQEFIDYKVNTVHDWKTPKTVKNRCNQIRKFGRMISNVYANVSVDLTAVVSPLDGKPQPKARGMTDEEVLKMRNKLYQGRSCAKYAPMLFVSSGVRMEELIHVHHEDINLEKGTVFVRNGKNGLHRNAVILPEYLPLWKEALEYARSKNWINLTGGKIDDKEHLKKNKQAVSKALTRAKKELDINTKQTSHAIRKNYCQTYYCRLRDKGYSSRRSWAILKDSIGHGEANRLDLRRLYLEQVWDK